MQDLTVKTHCLGIKLLQVLGGSIVLNSYHPFTVSKRGGGKVLNY